MNLLEYQGKDYFRRYGIPIPKGELIFKHSAFSTLKPPLVLKAQVPQGERNKYGGIVFVDDKENFELEKNRLFSLNIKGAVPSVLLAEDKINFSEELYLSFSYDTDFRSPVLALSKKGGVGISQAQVFPVNLIYSLKEFYLRDILQRAGITPTKELVKIIFSLWEMFQKERMILSEINPLFKLENGSYIAGDAKVILDDNIIGPDFRPYLELDGDIAVIASGGGASLINLDALIRNGGKPANYVEYSGNPPAEAVKTLTKRILSKSNLKGCWVVGGTANFTDILETMLGFVQGLREIKPKPTYPIVIRRDGPRQKEAFEMLEKVSKEEGFDFHLFGPETSMAESAEKIAALSYGK
jgi:succinyl-CoA synthetase beta subunit